MNIGKMNLVNRKTHSTPSYSLDGKETSIDLALNAMGDLLILGVVDSNYIHWASLTKTDDREVNEAIFNHIAKGAYEYVAFPTNALKAAGHPDTTLANWYHAHFTRATNEGRAWRTPFGYYYGLKDMENHGGYFAKAVASFPSTLQKRCHFREANGAYEKVLDYCLDTLESGMEYPEAKELIDMLKQEDYLLVSPNRQVRQKYIQVMEKATYIYNRYMDKVR